MWKDTASLSIILKSIVRESITDELMNQIGLYQVYENTWPASLCLSSSFSSSSSSASSSCSSSTHYKLPCKGDRILGIVQDYRSSSSSSSTLGDLRTLYRSGKFNETISKRPHIDRTSFEQTTLFYFISGHPDLHGGNILLREDGKFTCIDVDMAWSGSPGCLMGPLQMPCVFGAVHGFSTPCMFQTHNVEGRHDECPYFPEADLAFSERSIRVVRDMNVDFVISYFLNSQERVNQVCDTLHIDLMLCPRVEDIFGEHAVSMFRLRIEILREILEMFPGISMRSVYRSFLPKLLYRALQRNVTSMFDESWFRFRDVY